MASDDEGTESGHRSRSQSRRARRKKQTNKQQQQQKQQQMGTVEEENGQQQPNQEQQAALAQARYYSEAHNDKGQTQSETQMVQNLPNQSKPNAMQPFEWIGPDSTSMDGPVTYARAMRGEIPMRPGNPEQSLATGRKPDGSKAGGGSGSDLMDQDGLKLRIELNIDIEIELKARIHGDLTLALL